jgi:hypothetical protein
MCPPSLSLAPSANVDDCRSDPAKSTKFNIETFALRCRIFVKYLYCAAICAFTTGIGVTLRLGIRISRSISTFDYYSKNGVRSTTIFVHVCRSDMSVCYFCKNFLGKINVTFSQVHELQYLLGGYYNFFLQISDIDSSLWGYKTIIGYVTSKCSWIFRLTLSGASKSRMTSLYISK